jgi:hypothetical protein
MAATAVGPIGARQINRNFYVGQSDLTTIQKAVDAAVSANGGVVYIPWDYAGSDSVSAATGSASVQIKDYRSASVQSYVWFGGRYIPASFNQLSGFMSQNVADQPFGSSSFYYDPQGTSGVGTGNFVTVANQGKGMPSLQLKGTPGDGGQQWTFLRCDLDPTGTFKRIQMPERIEVYNPDTTYALWLGQNPDINISKGMYVWPKPSENAIDLQGLTAAGANPYNQTIRLNYLGGDVVIGKNATVSEAGNLTMSGNLEVANLTVTGDAIVDGELQADSTIFNTCEVDGSPVRTFANSPGPGGMIWPKSGVAVSAGDHWQDPSIDPATLAYVDRSNTFQGIIQMEFNAFAGITSPTSGFTLAWNLTNSVGETDFINTGGSGGGGFNWYNVASNVTVNGNTAPKMALQNNNVLKIYGGLGNLLLAAATTGATYGAGGIVRGGSGADNQELVLSSGTTHGSMHFGLDSAAGTDKTGQFKFWSGSGSGLAGGADGNSPIITFDRFGNGNFYGSVAAQKSLLALGAGTLAANRVTISYINPIGYLDVVGQDNVNAGQLSLRLMSADASILYTTMHLQGNNVTVAGGVTAGGGFQGNNAVLSNSGTTNMSTMYLESGLPGPGNFIPWAADGDALIAFNRAGNDTGGLSIGAWGNNGPGIRIDGLNNKVTIYSPTASFSQNIEAANSGSFISAGPIAYNNAIGTAGQAMARLMLAINGQGGTSYPGQFVVTTWSGPTPDTAGMNADTMAIRHVNGPLGATGWIWMLNRNGVCYTSNGFSCGPMRNSGRTAQAAFDAAGVNGSTRFVNLGETTQYAGGFDFWGWSDDFSVAANYLTMSHDSNGKRANFNVDRVSASYFFAGNNFGCGAGGDFTVTVGSAISCWQPLTCNAGFNVAGGSKNFIIDHPLDETKSLVHSCLEGPEVGVFYRGEVTLTNGGAIVTLPDYFESLVYPDNRSVLLTQIDDDKELAILAASRIIAGKFYIRSSVKDATVAWEVKAVRRLGGVAEFEVVVDRVKPERMTVPEPIQEEATDGQRTRGIDGDGAVEVGELRTKT